MMLGTLSDRRRDEYGKGHDQRRSLLLDTVMPTRPKAFGSRLLRMPAEILANVVDLLTDNKRALASLALVNSDCRQLARCCQFAEIRFDYSPQAQQLLLAIAAEALDSSQQFRIGPCVRRVTFASSGSCISKFHPELYDSIWGEAAYLIPRKQHEKYKKEANEYYVGLRKRSVLAISHAMPNLEVLSWGDPFSLDEDFFKKVPRSSARDIRLKRVFIDNPWRMEPPLTPKTWPLRSLHLNIALASGQSTDATRSGLPGQGVQKTDSINPMSNFFGTLFQLCSPTIESLNWTYRPFPEKNPISLADYPISFPHLRQLRLDVPFFDPHSVSSFLSSPLRHLELSSVVLALCGSSLSTYGPYRDLQSFIITTLPDEEEVCVHISEFIKRHSYIRKLSIHERPEARNETAHLNHCIIPTLVNYNFSYLRSLSLGWGGGSVEEATKPHDTQVSEDALMAIGNMTSLEQLSLSSGITFGWRRQWLVDHAKLRRSLQGLKRLKMLALVRDTYPIPIPPYDVEEYYVLRIAQAGECADAETRPEFDLDDATQAIDALGIDGRTGERLEVKIWERAHRNRMLTHAEAYAEVLPALEWMLCGQRPIGLKRDPKNPNTALKGVPLTKHRDECITFLNKTFGLATDDGC